MVYTDAIIQGSHSEFRHCSGVPTGQPWDSSGLNPEPSRWKCQTLTQTDGYDRFVFSLKTNVKDRHYFNNIYTFLSFARTPQKECSLKEMVAHTVDPAMNSSSDIPFPLLSFFPLSLSLWLLCGSVYVCACACACACG